MTPAVIAGANCLLQPPSDWDGEIECLPLAVRVEGNTVQSAWTPDAEVLAALNAGGFVVLTIYGGVPPVALHVEPQHPVCARCRNPNHHVSDCDVE